MSYTICDKYGACAPLRMIVPNVHGEPELKAEFTPNWWACDPCNRSERRYEVTYRSTQLQTIRRRTSSRSWRITGA